MSSARLRELPPSVVDEFVSMQLKDSQRISDASSLDTPNTDQYKVEYRLLKKKKAKRYHEADMNMSPSSLRYQSPIPSGRTLKPIGQSAPNKPPPNTPFIPERRQVKTPELIKLSVQRFSSVDSVMYPLRGSGENDSLHQKLLPAIESRNQSGKSTSSRQPSVTHRFVCPQCKCDIVKEMYVTVSDDSNQAFEIKLNHRSSIDRPDSTVTSGTQTDVDDTEPSKESETVVNESVSTIETERQFQTAEINTVSVVETDEQIENVHENEVSTTESEKHIETAEENSVSVGETEKQSAELKNSSRVTSSATVDDASQGQSGAVTIDTTPQPDFDEPLEPIEISSEDLDLVEKCRKIIQDAENDGSTESISSAVQQLAIIAQQKLTPSSLPAVILQHNRLVCGKIGDVISEESFTLRLSQLLSMLSNSMDFFEGEENYHLSLNLFTCLTSFLTASIRLPANLMDDPKVVSDILLILNNKKFVSQLTQKNVWRLFEACLTLFSHLSRDGIACDTMHSMVGILSTISKFLSTGDLGYVGIWAPATVALSRICEEDSRELAKSVAGKLSDFIPKLCSYVSSYFDTETPKPENVDQEGHDNLPSSTVLMPSGASVRVVEVVWAFMQYISLILDKNKEDDADFRLSQPELEELQKCSLFLIDIPRPIQPNGPENPNPQLFLGDWRYLIRCGLEMASTCQQLAYIRKLDQADYKKKLEKSLESFIESKFYESSLKKEALHLKVDPPKSRSPTPAPRSRTETKPEPETEIVKNIEKSLKSTPEVLHAIPIHDWHSGEVKAWFTAIGLESYVQNFEEYDGSMLAALCEVRRESPQFFQEEITAKLGGKFDAYLRFTSELGKLCVANHLMTPSVLNSANSAMA